MRKLALGMIVFCFVYSCSNPEEIHFKITAGEKSYIDCPIQINLTSIFSIVPEYVQLAEVKDGKPENIVFQYDQNFTEKALFFIAEGPLLAGESRTYILRSLRSKQKSKISNIDISQDDDELRISDKGQSILNYRKSDKMPPPGVDIVYKRSAYIHPLFSPGGEVLTRIQPPDHYHHYGIWNPWTKTHINGREIDYWNLAKGEGTVRTKAILNHTAGPLYGDFTALHECVDFGDPDGERVTMDEFWDVRYWRIEENADRYILDLTTSFRNIILDTILFDAYRYGGGLGYRALENWKADNSTVLTSEGKDRKNADGSRAKWCIVEGESGVAQGRSGILFLSYSENREHPEPMRVWPTDVNNGEMFFEFCPIRLNEWVIEPGKEYQLKYRMIVFDGTMTADEAEMYWNAFAEKPSIVFQ